MMNPATPTATASASFALINETLSQQQFPIGTLYVVATPIGNVADISLRALHLLALCDVIACEDTRNTAQLMGRYGLHKPLLAAHQHNEHEIAEKIIQRLRAGERVALVSDAGTPAISDPGAIIVDHVLKANLPVTPLPGASAALSALSASGLLQQEFYFIGFLPSKTSQRETRLRSLLSLPATMIFYEAPHRIMETTQSLQQVFGDHRQLVFARELSKLFEEIHRCKLADASAWLKADAYREKGEYVLLLEGASAEQDQDQQEAQRVLQILLSECSVKQAASLAAQITGQKKNALYQLALQLQNAP